MYRIVADPASPSGRVPTRRASTTAPIGAPMPAFSRLSSTTSSARIPASHRLERARTNDTTAGAALQKAAGSLRPRRAVRPNSGSGALCSSGAKTHRASTPDLFVPPLPPIHTPPPAGGSGGGANRRPAVRRGSSRPTSSAVFEPLPRAGWHPPIRPPTPGRESDLRAIGISSGDVRPRRREPSVCRHGSRRESGCRRRGSARNFRIRSRAGVSPTAGDRPAGRRDSANSRRPAPLPMVPAS